MTAGSVGSVGSARRARRSFLSRATLVTALGAIALTALPGGVGTAHAQEADIEEETCRDPVTGDDLPDNAGPHALIGLLGLRHAWDLSMGTGVDVAVVDSGVDHRHPDLDENAVYDGTNLTLVRDEREFVPSTPAPPMDCHGHGTGIAGLVGGDRIEGDRMAGVAPNARIYPVRTHDPIEQASHNMVAAMINDAVDADVDVINLSFAVVHDHDVIREAVENALANDIVVVAAGGNEGNEGVGGGRMYPAAYPGVLAVAAVNDLGEPLESSNAGDWIDVAAYGEGLTLLAPGGEGYRQDGGTSFAAAQVSGTAALVLSRFPELSAEQVTDRILASAAPVEGARSAATGAGIVDPFGALTHSGGEGDMDAAGAAETVAVQPVPEETPMISSTVATALVWSGILMLAMIMGLFAVPAVRRAMRRNWHAGPLPAPPVPTTPEPSADLLRRLDGSDIPPPPQDDGRPARRAVAVAAPLDQKRN